MAGMSGYGCTILRHYLDVEKGDLYKALNLYNGTPGEDGKHDPEFPNRVIDAWRKQWSYRLSADPVAVAPVNSRYLIENISE